MDIHVVPFKGIQEVAFYNSDGLAAYLKKEGTSLEKALEDMENNPMPDWEVDLGKLSPPHSVSKSILTTQRI